MHITARKRDRFGRLLYDMIKLHFPLYKKLTMVYNRIGIIFVFWEDAMSITFNEELRIFKLDTPDSTYTIKISPTGFLLHLYYGAYVPDTDLGYLHRMIGVASTSALVPSDEENGLSLDTAYLEYPCEGAGDMRISALSIRGENGANATDIRYREHKIYKGKPAIPGLPATYVNSDDEADTLEIIAVDGLTGAEVTLFYTVFNKLNVITRSVKIKNTADKPLILSGCILQLLIYTEPILSFSTFRDVGQKKELSSRESLISVCTVFIQSAVPQAIKATHSLHLPATDIRRKAARYMVCRWCTQAIFPPRLRWIFLKPHVCLWA